jgi:hypothetical protein
MLTLMSDHVLPIHAFMYGLFHSCSVMNFRSNSYDRPRAMSIRFQSLIDEIQLQGKDTRIDLPSGLDLIKSYMHALRKWPNAHAYAERYYTDKLREWDEQAQSDPTSAYANVGEKYLQICKDLITQVNLWDSGSHPALSNTPPELVARAKHAINEQSGLGKRKFIKRQDGKPPKPIKSIKDIFGLSEELFQERKAADACYKCGEKHRVFACRHASQAQKSEYKRVLDHSREVASKNEGPSKRAKTNK